jgi:hypothetical protein|tara:strand:- start:1470 stop:1835 length:366 start_codon:yes stop_codon:yes gene_type:complete
MSIEQYLKSAPEIITKNIDRYLEKSKDTEKDYITSKEPECVFAPAYYDGWADFDVYDDTLWIRTAYCGNPEETKEAWEELKELARSMKCKKIQFSTKRDGKAWERLFKDMKVVQWKIEVEL